MCMRVMFSKIITKVDNSSFPKYVKVFLFESLSISQWNRMSVALESFYIFKLFTIPPQVEFYTCICVAGCGCPISQYVVRKTISSLELRNRSAHSSYEDDIIKCLIIYDMVRISPLFSLWLNLCTSLKTIILAAELVLL